MALQHVASGEVFPLAPLAGSLVDTPTHAILKSEQLELVRIVLRKGKTLPQHGAPGEITVLCLEGRIDFESDGLVKILGPGDCIHLRRNVPHALRAISDASALLTLRVG